MTTAIDQIYLRFNDDTEPPELDWGERNIQQFYAGKSLFLTGATGFMGKVFVEKVLRDCPDLKRLYVLVRQKNGVTPQDIMKKYFQNKIFDRLRDIEPDFENKVLTVTGDLEKDGVGLSAEDRQSLVDNVDIIVHNGAITKFDESISIALKVNVLGTKSMLDLAMECKHIQVFVYMSTAYSHCYRKDIEETFYESPADLKMVHDMIASDQLAKHGLTREALKMLLGEWPNIYCFAKATSEGLVKQYGDTAHFAMGVYRPSVVTAALKEPLPGWVGNNQGPALVFLGAGLGIIRAAFILGYPTDMVPVDFSINSLIAIIYDLPQRWKIEKQAAVYNYGSSTLNPISFQQMMEYLLIEEPTIGSMNLVWYPSVVFCQSMWTFWFLHFFVHFIPSILADIVMLCLGKKPRALRVFYFGTKHLDKMDYFANGNWRIYAHRTMELHDRLSKIDQAIFSFDIRKMDWAITTMTYTRGSRLYMLKEPFDNVEQSKRRFQRMKWLHYITMSAVASLTIYLAMTFILYLINWCII